MALHVYQSDRLSYLHLSATVMGRITTFEQGRIAYSYATTADLEANAVPVAECDGLVDIVRRVDGCEIALFLKEVPGGKVRGNLRAKSARDISVVAREMGRRRPPGGRGLHRRGRHRPCARRRAPPSSARSTQKTEASS